MGVVHQEYLDGMNIYRCRQCSNFLSTRDFRSSTQFTCAQGPAWLFQKVMNVCHRKAEPKILATGRHVIRDVHCKRCDSKLGWYYEMAFMPGQKYKETQTVLEVQAIKQSVNIGARRGIRGRHLRNPDGSASN